MRIASATGPRESFHRHKPLFRQKRLDNDTGSRAVRNGVMQWFDFFNQAQRSQIGDDFIACDDFIEARIGAARFVMLSSKPITEIISRP
jgi:hypothetical protein